MKGLLSADSLRDLTEDLRQANEEFTRLYPGETGRRQSVHTVYGGAHLFKSDSAKRLGSLARRSLDQFAPDFIVFARALDLPGANQLPKQSPMPTIWFELEGPELCALLTSRRGWPTKFMSV